MKSATAASRVLDIESLILTVRGRKVILDCDLAWIYRVPTKRLNEQVKRNRGRFPSDFHFRLTLDEAEAAFMAEPRTAAGSSAPPGCRPREVTGGPINLRSQNATSSWRHGGRRYLPYAFTEQGAIMAANVLNSPPAVRMSVFVVRAFVRMREMLGGTRDLAQKLAVLEKELKKRLDIHEAAIVDILQRVLEILNPLPVPEPPRRQIGFHVEPEEGVATDGRSAGARNRRPTSRR